MRSLTRNAFLLGLLSLLIPLTGIGWWIYVTQTNPGDHFAMQQQFRSPFPDFMSQHNMITWVMMLFGANAFWMFMNAFEEDQVNKWLSISMLGLSGLIVSWLLFTLM